MQGLRLADQRKTEFLATLAHELRNPLAPLSTALALLQMQEAQCRGGPAALRDDAAPGPAHGAPDRRPHGGLAHHARQDRAQARGAARWSSVVADAVELSRPLLNGARHELELTLPDESLNVRGDRVRLTQVFSNLLNNAAKYTPAGGRIAVTVERA